VGLGFYLPFLAAQKSDFFVLSFLYLQQSLVLCMVYVLISVCRQKPFANGDCHMHFFDYLAKDPRIQMGIKRGPLMLFFAYGDLVTKSPKCRQKPFANRLVTGLSPYVYGTYANHRTHMGIASCCCPYAYWEQANHCMHTRNGDVAVIPISICILELTESLYAYGNIHMNMGIEHATCPCIQMGIAICIQ
jgi:hypothetical protein